jgi:hypothetical protein
MTSTSLAWVFFAGDALCLALFVLLGMRLHEMLDVPQPALRFLLNVGPFWLAWGLAGLSLRAFRFPRPLRLRVVWARTLNAWLVAAPLAIVARALLLGRATIVLMFMLVTLGLGGGALLVWRGLGVWGARRWGADHI